MLALGCYVPVVVMVERYYGAVVYYIGLIYALSVPVEHKPQATFLYPALSCAATSIFLQLYLKFAVHVYFSKSFFQVSFGLPLSPWSCGVHCDACLTVLLLFLLSVCPSQFDFILSGFWWNFRDISLWHTFWRANFAEITRDRPRKPAREIKLMLSCISWALAQISCILSGWSITSVCC